MMAEHLATLSKKDVIAELKRIMDDAVDSSKTLTVFLERVRYLSEAKDEIEVAASDFREVADELSTIIAKLEKRRGMKAIYTNSQAIAFCSDCRWTGEDTISAEDHARSKKHQVVVHSIIARRYDGRIVCEECGGANNHPTWYPDPCPECQGKGYVTEEGEA